MNNTINNNRLRIDNINYPKIKNKRKKYKLRKVNCFILLATSALIIGTGMARPNVKEYPTSIPTGYVQIYTTEQVEKNDTLTTIAEKYYNKDIYSAYYRSLDDYIEEIAKTNNISKNNITPFQSLTIPALTTQNNIYLERIESINKQINTLDVWVEYQIKAGDTISSLAYKGAGDDDEAYTIVKRIMDYNKMNNANIYAGDTIYIINPEIGDLKKEIFQLKESLNESLKTNDDDLTKIH